MPIQSSSSTMAAVIFADIIRYMRERSMKSKPVLFIHDSVETDVYPYELLEVLEYQKLKLATGAIDYFGIECKADISLGLSLGHECELAEIEITNDDKTEGYLTLEGWRDEIEETTENWKLAYNVVEVVEDSWKDVYIYMDQAFIPRKAFDPTVRTTRQKGHVKYRIRYYDENGSVNPINI